ncbi:MAG TPA: CARDB domain-containing protein [archaeon]|nr:CARDB domain-containing protein [archaeon]
MRTQTLMTGIGVVVIAVAFAAILATSAEAAKPRPDLAPTITGTTVVYNYGSNGSIVSGNVAVTVRVSNIGNRAAEASTLSVNLGAGTQTASIGSLAAGASQSASVTFSNLARFTYTVTATADSTSAVSESNENNNVATTSVTV